MTKEPKSKQSAGGIARAAALSPKRRGEIARAAAVARWRKDTLEESENVRRAAEAAGLPHNPGNGATLDGRCESCGTVWVVAALPMDLFAVIKLARKTLCPSCGSKKATVAISQKNLAEVTAKARDLGGKK